MRKPKGGKPGIREQRAATAVSMQYVAYCQACFHACGVCKNFIKVYGMQGRVHPKKRLYRARAHSNPLSDMRLSDVPTTPADVDW